ncbi:MAG: hypothetical protein B6I31_05495 [Desulfobacteraceae bacterium 4572_19]|nr:MAG: hypothetical protein B6I31_05495 [Desulfobacteraceae bacterium 4572_19]
MVEFVTIQGKQYPVRVSYSVLKNVKASTGKSIDMDSSQDYELYESILFFALKSGAKAQGIEFNWKIEQMEEVLDECFFEFINLIPLFFPKNLKAAREMSHNKKK